MTNAYINRIATALPPHDVHEAFLRFGHSLLGAEERKANLFERMALRSDIDHRYSFLAPPGTAVRGGVPAESFYVRGRFPGTAERMRVFEDKAPELAQAAIQGLNLGEDVSRITHVIVTCCTGLSAPGLDFEIMVRCGLPKSVERTVIGFMGCYAAMNALKLARHIVRSEPDAKVIVLSLELCSLHLQETFDLEEMLSFMIFGDGCAAALITSDPVGIGLDSFRTLIIPDSRELITWNIGNSGFDMVLSGQVPARTQAALRARAGEILGNAEISSVGIWAVHPGGRTILDAVEHAFGLRPEALSASRDVLRKFGNMSSATILFVLQRALGGLAGVKGCGMAFGPGMTAETMLFHTA